MLKTKADVLTELNATVVLDCVFSFTKLNPLKLTCTCVWVTRVCVSG